MAVESKRSKDQIEWNATLKSLPNPHLLQSWEWGELKCRYGWTAIRLIWQIGEGKPVAAAQVLQRRILAGFSILYCPRGPILDWSDEDLRLRVITDLQDLTRETGAIFLKIDPEVTISSTPHGSTEELVNPLGKETEGHFEQLGFTPSQEQIQFRNTLQLDLNPSEDEILAGMKQKTRYNIRLATRKGVRAFLGGQEDFELMYRMYAETSLRDNFAIRDGAYYQDVWNGFHYAGMAQPFIAAVEGNPIAGLIVFRYGETAWYLYGMSRAQHRDTMPNHLLQWEAIKWAKATGSTSYDFWGAPDDLDPSDPMWGVYRFKSGFGATFVRTLGAWDFVARPILYQTYTSILPKVLSVLRVRGVSQTRQALE